LSLPPSRCRKGLISLDSSNIALAFGIAVAVATWFGIIGVKRHRKENSWWAKRLEAHLDKDEAKKNYMLSIQETAEKAGIPIEPKHILIAVCAGMLAGAGAGLAITGEPVFMFTGILTGIIAPYGYVNYRIQGRRRAFEDQLEQCLRRMSSGLQAGLSIQQALDQTAEWARLPARDVMGKIVTLTRTGYSLTRAVEEASRIINSKDLNLMAAAISLHMQVGGELNIILDQIADTIRDRKLFRAKVTSVTAEGSLTANVLAFLPFVMIGLMRLASPEYVRPLFGTPRGIAVFLICSGFIAVGWIILRRMTAFEG